MGGESGHRKKRRWCSRKRMGNVEERGRIYKERECAERIEIQRGNSNNKRKHIDLEVLKKIKTFSEEVRRK